MNVLGAIIKDNEITGITQVYYVHESRNFFYEFSIITRSGLVKFQSPIIEDIHIATKQEQLELLRFKADYVQIKKYVACLLNEVVEEHRAHVDKVDDIFKEIADQYRILENSLSSSKAKGKGGWLKQLESIRPNLIALKQLAE